MLRCFLSICVSGRKVPFFGLFHVRKYWDTVLRLSECDAANDTDTSQRKHCLHGWDWWPVMTVHELKCCAGTIVALTFQAFTRQKSTILLIFAVQQRIFGIYFYPSLDLGPHRIAWPVNLKKKLASHLSIFCSLEIQKLRQQMRRSCCWPQKLLTGIFNYSHDNDNNNNYFVLPVFIDTKWDNKKWKVPNQLAVFLPVFVMQKKKKKTFKVFLCLFQGLSHRLLCFDFLVFTTGCLLSWTFLWSLCM